MPAGETAPFCHCLEIGDLDRLVTTKEKFSEFRGFSDDFLLDWLS